jgi:inner membrane protein
MPYVTSFLIGAASHIFLDSFNPAGVPLFWPINKHFHIANFKSGGIMDRCMGLTLWIIAFLLLWKMTSSAFSL